MRAQMAYGPDATDAASVAFDALGRFRTRTLTADSSVDTYSYVGSSEVVARIANSVGGTVDSIVDADGNRLGTDGGAAMNWFVPDLHGNVAALLEAADGPVGHAIRYDPWGEIVATGAAGGAAPPVGQGHWKYQGRLDVSPPGVNVEPLYDLSARFYSASLGVFIQLDTVMGSAQNPLSMNRFLYAHANPATLIDPTGHGVDCGLGMPCTEDERRAENQRQQEHQQRKRQYDTRRRSSASATSAGRTASALVNLKMPALRPLLTLILQNWLIPTFSKRLRDLTSSTL